MSPREDQTKIELILDNDAAIDDNGWALIAPFGEWPKQRIQKVNDVPTLQKFIQVLDNAAADALLDRESGFFRTIKRALVGIPVYGGGGVTHPDLGKHSPDTLSNARGREKVIGVVDQIRKGAKGIEAHFSLTPDGADVVENEGCKFPSAVWHGDKVGMRGDAILFKPNVLISVGLTKTPNISGVESLANAVTEAEQAPIETKEPDMKLIAGFLMGKGTTLANAETPTESMVLEAIQKIYNDLSGRVVTLGNEKDTLAGNITTLTNEKTNLTSRITALEGEKTTLANEVTGLKTTVKAERKSAASAVVDLAIHKGKLTVAERDAQIETLTNAADFPAASKALLDRSGKVIKLRDDTQSGKVLANAGAEGSAPTARDQYCDAMADHMKANPTDGPIVAHKKVMAKYPALADALKVQGEAAGKEA